MKSVKLKHTNRCNRGARYEHPAQRTDCVVMGRTMKVLHLTLKKKWFDMIASGEKKEEYREIKPYWDRRLNNKRFDAIQFRNGYSPTSPTMLIELRDHLSGLGVTEWGAPERESVHILRLGRILQAP